MANQSVNFTASNLVANPNAAMSPAQLTTTINKLIADYNLQIGSNKLAPGVMPPSGSITNFAGSAAPVGWLITDGSSLSTASYAALFAVIGYTYGGSGSNFNLPSISSSPITIIKT